MSRPVSAFDRLDTNHDGVITRSEFNQAMGPVPLPAFPMQQSVQVALPPAGQVGLGLPVGYQASSPCMMEPMAYAQQPATYLSGGIQPAGCMAGNMTASFAPPPAMHMGQPSMLAGLTPPPPMPMPGATVMSMGATMAQPVALGAPMPQPVAAGAPVMMQAATFGSYAPAAAAYGSYAPATVTTAAYGAPMQASVASTTGIPMAAQGASYASYAPAIVTPAAPATVYASQAPAVTYASAADIHRVTAGGGPAIGTPSVAYRTEAAAFEQRPTYPTSASSYMPAPTVNRRREETMPDMSSAGQRVVGERPISREELFSTGNLVDGPAMAPPAPAPRPLTTSYGSVPRMSTPPLGYDSRVARTSSATSYAPAAQQPLRTCYGEASSLNVGSAQGQFVSQADIRHKISPSSLNVGSDQGGFVSQADFRHKINRLQEGRGGSQVGRSQGLSYATSAYEPAATYAAASSAFDRMDRNHDGVISRSEFNQAMGRPGQPVAVI